MTTEDRISRSKIFLAKSSMYPFFAYLLFMLKVVEDKECPSIGTDGEELIYNPKFIDGLNDQELLGTLLHEVMHIALGHLWRRGDRNAIAVGDKGEPVSLWNIAADYIINNEIEKYNDVKLPSPRLSDSKYEGWYTEQVYKDLLKNAKTIKIKCGSSFEKDNNGKPCRGSHDKWGKKSEAQRKKLEKRWKRAVKQAGEIHKKQKGDLPEGLQRMVDATEPKVDWRDILASYVVKCQNDYSYRQPDRRFLGGEFIMPSLEEGDKIEDIVIAMDTSGSIDDKILSEFLGEVKGLLGAFDSVRVHVCSWDTECYGWREISDFANVSRPTGGGGTDTTCIFKEIKKRELNPVCVLIFTDGYCNYPSKSPLYDVLWLLTKEHEKPPWGRNLFYDN